LSQMVLMFLQVSAGVGMAAAAMVLLQWKREPQINWATS
jgi:hypothetical protein